MFDTQSHVKSQDLSRSYHVPGSCKGMHGMLSYTDRPPSRLCTKFVVILTGRCIMRVVVSLVAWVL